MRTPPPDELLYDSEASLRLVDRALTDLAVAPVDTVAGSAPDRSSTEAFTRISLMDLPNLLLRAYSEINSVLENLRHSRDVLQQTTVDKLQHTNNKLREVSSATEVAATDMLDGLDRALALVDELDAPDQAEDERGTELRSELRNELFCLMNCLQFQDITTQQLNYASSVLVEMETRLAELAKIFDPDQMGLSHLMLTTESGVAFDPAATTTNAEERQALVDQIFTGR
jgi:chemotaxis regulatin CheY-phosphate phosphatase CheZ